MQVKEILQNAMSERTPLNRREYASLQTLFAMVSAFEMCPANLRERAEAAGCAEDLRTIAKLCDESLGKILKTVPERKLMHIDADPKNVRLYIKIEPPGLSTPYTAFSYTPTRALNELLNYLCQHECSLCDMTPVEARKCPYRAVIEEALPHDVDGMDREHCKYSDMVLGLE